MNLSYNWLKDIVEIDASPEELAEMLTAAGCTVEEMEAVGDDTMLVAEVTTNRPDWLCHLGAAHEIAALTGKSFKQPPMDLNETGPDVNTLTSVTVEDAAQAFCPRYTARVIQGVTVKESPAWLKDRLVSIGQRPINNIVDITNLVCFEMNQPLHAFDYDLLAENRIVVRMAHAKEPFHAITGEDGVLTPERLVIADAEKAVAVAGVKGGGNSEVHAGTVNVLLESAWFQPQQVRRSARTLKMDSESSYRFERGIDPGMTERASARAAHLILELAGGTLATGVVDTNPELAKPWDVEMRFDRCTSVLGIYVERAEVEKIFRGLGLEILRTDATGVKVRVPTFRQDLTREIDLIEEVVRVVGFDRVPSKIAMPIALSRESSSVSGARVAKDVLVGLGYYETFNDSFVPEAWLPAYPLAAGEVPVRVQNPVNAERPCLRSTLIPSLLEIRRVNRDAEDVRLFDQGHVYIGADSVCEPVHLALLDDRGLPYVRGACEAVLAAVGPETVAVIEPMDDISAFAAGTAAKILLGGRVIGMMGVLSASEVKRHDLTLAPAALEFDFGAVVDAPRRERLFRDLPRFPGVRRDIALVVPEAVLWSRIETCACEAAERMESIRFESVYRGKGIATGQKSVAFSLLFRAPDRSLTDDEVNALRDAVVERLTTSIDGAALR